MYGDRVSIKSNLLHDLVTSILSSLEHKGGGQPSLSLDLLSLVVADNDAEEDSSEDEHHKGGRSVYGFLFGHCDTLDTKELLVFPWSLYDDLAIPVCFNFINNDRQDLLYFLFCRVQCQLGILPACSL